MGSTSHWMCLCYGPQCSAQSLVGPTRSPLVLSTRRPLTLRATNCCFLKQGWGMRPVVYHRVGSGPHGGFRPSRLPTVEAQQSCQNWIAVSVRVWRSKIGSANKVDVGLEIPIKISSMPAGIRRREHDVVSMLQLAGNQKGLRCDYCGMASSEFAG